MAGITDDDILRNFGGVSQNNLNSLMESFESDTNEISLSSFSPYKLMEEIPVYFKDYKTNFTILTLNCQSLNAKIDKIKIMIKFFHDHGLIISAICLQETWIKNQQDGQAPDMSFYQLPGYQYPVSLGASCGDHGGLAIYLIEGLKFTEICTYNSRD